MARGVSTEEDFVSWWCSGHNRSLNLVKGFYDDYMTWRSCSQRRNSKALFSNTTVVKCNTMFKELLWKKVAPKSVHFEGKKFWNHHIYSIGSSRLPNRAGLWNFATFLSNMKPNLINSLCRWSSMWLHHKIRRKRKQKPSSSYEALSWISNWNMS